VRPISSFGLGKRILWRVLWYPTRVLAALVFRLDIAREAPIPGGPVVFAPNHLAHPDPPFVGLAVRRPLRFMALDELWGESKILDQLFRVFGAIPLPRTRYPLTAMRAALEHLESGGAVGVFPEGRRVHRWGDEHPRRGAAWLAMRTGALIVPVAVWGSQRTMPIGTLRLRPAKVFLRVGRPIDPDAFLDQEDPLGAIMHTWESWVTGQLAELSSGEATHRQPG